MSKLGPAFTMGLRQPTHFRSHVRGRRPPQVLAALPSDPERPRWAPRVASATVHAAIIALVVLLPRLAAERPQATAAHTSDPARTVSMVYLPPLRKPARAALKPPAPPPPEARPRVHPPDPPKPPPTPPPPQQVASAASELNRDGMTSRKLPKVPDHDAPVAMARTPGGAAAAAEMTEDQLMVFEAQRLFGPHGAASRPGQDGVAGPVTRAGMPVYLTAGGRCAATGAVADTSGAEGNGRDGMVEGIVRDERSGTILPGAFLQIIGTGYATFADDVGHYRLAFDPTLVGPCRTQVVRVTARGYRAQNLVLSLGYSDNTVRLDRH
jgi:hypothetical protein